jgi:endonuclease III
MPDSQRKKTQPSASKDSRTERLAALMGPTTDSAIAKIYDALSKTISPESDLHYNNTFELLVAVVLSAQATDASVNLATPALFAAAPTPQAMAALGATRILPYIRRIGLAPTKAKNVAALAAFLIERHGGEVPDTREELEALPGVGRKTASVVLNVAFGQPTIAVDTHVHRVANRLGIAVTSTPEQSEQVLLQRTPRKHLLHAHHYLILHGRYTCVARGPKCGQCPVSRWCPSFGSDAP